VLTVCDLRLSTCGNECRHLMLTARQVAVHLLVVCGVGDGECRAQVTQERKPHPMVEVCQLTDVRGECAVGRGGRWRALFWKGGDVRGDDSWRSRTLFTPSEVVGGIGHWSGVSYLSYY
jgi:hypothetical protein